MSQHYDVIIIGSGAGGAALAYKLAPSGKRILILERGGHLPREPDNWDPRAVFVASKYKTKEKWVDQYGRSFEPLQHYYVGGNTKVYGAALFRLRESDFLERRGDGLTAPPWPIGYSEFAPYYLEAERLFEVHGQRGSDPTEPRCAEDYPCPPISHDPLIGRLFDALTRCGYNPFPIPSALYLDEAHPETSTCVRCEHCDGFPCPLHAKADAETACLDPALRHANVTFQTNAFVERLEAKSAGRAITGVQARCDGHVCMFTSDLVAVACGAINSAALLLRSATHEHPYGLANSSGLVGRNYMCHANSAAMALISEPNDSKFQKTFGVNDFYLSDRKGLRPPLGHIQLLGKIDADQLSALAPITLPKSILGRLAGHSIDFWLMSEDFPDPENRVVLTETGQIRLIYRPNNQEAHDGLLKQFKVMINEARERSGLSQYAFLSQRVPIEGVSHQCGTLRFGHDQVSSVLDSSCRAHEIDNLYVVDGSFFPSSGAINPSLTIVANALRVGDIINQRLK
jgi:choline dehydrogenase-like flavoprotein